MLRIRVEDVMFKNILVLSFLSIILFFFSSANILCSDLKVSRIVLKDLEYAEEYSSPVLKYDSEGNIHLLFIAYCTDFTNKNPISGTQLCYYKYAYPDYERIVEFETGKDLDACNLQLDSYLNIHITQDGYVYCIYGYHDYNAAIFDKNGRMLKIVSLGKHRQKGWEAVTRRNAFVYITASPSGSNSLFTEIDTLGSFKYIGDKSSKTAISSYRQNPAKVIEISPDILLCISYYVENGPGKEISLIQYSTEEEKIIMNKNIDLGDDKFIQSFDKNTTGLHAYEESNGFIKVIAYRKDENNHNKLIVFTLDDKFELVESPSIKVGDPEKLSLGQTDFQNIVVNFIRTEMPDLGYFQSTVLSEDKVFQTKSSEIPFFHSEKYIH